MSDVDAGSDTLVAHKITKSYGALQAVAPFSLRLRAGECLAVLGPNGAGKTTAIEMLEGLSPCDAGEIYIFGMPLQTRRREIMEHVGVVLQETQLYKKFTVRETLTLFASFYRQKADIPKILERLGLSEKADWRLEKLSGGQRQRAYLGCALVNFPRLLFLDEPTTGLDPQARRMIWDLLKELKTEGASLLLTTHYMDEAAFLADRVAIMDSGKIIAEGSPQQLIAATCGEQILWFQLQGMSGEDAEWHRALRAEIPWAAAAKAADGGLEASLHDPLRGIKDLLAFAESYKVVLNSIRLRSGTLEDVFLKLTGRSLRDA